MQESCLCPAGTETPGPSQGWGKADLSSRFFSQAKQKTGLTLFEGHSGALTETAKPAASDTVN